MSKPVQEVISDLVQANYIGDVQGLAVVFINKDGQVEINIGFHNKFAYTIISGLEILKFRMLTDIIDNAVIQPKQRD